MKGKSTQKIPPCQNSQKQHTSRANFQTAIQRRALQADPMCDPHFWWVWMEEGYTDCLEIQKNTCNPTPFELFDLSCNRHEERKEDRCPCITNKLACTYACHSFCCKNPFENDFKEESCGDDEYV